MFGIIAVLFMYHFTILYMPEIGKKLENLGSFNLPSCKFLICCGNSTDSQDLVTEEEAENADASAQSEPVSQRNSGQVEDSPDIESSTRKTPAQKGNQMSYFELGLFVIGYGLAISQLVFRHSDWSWILLNILGYMECVIVPGQIKVTNLKLLTLLLMSFFAYDIFMVFLTPYLTPKGESIMVEVATGAGTGEQLPLLFKVPKFAVDPFLKTCGRGYSMLGFGDIIIPGIATSFCVRLDEVVRARRTLKSYTFWSIVSYAIGLLVCFVGMHWSGQGQPALLYICPAMIVSAALVGFFRGELSNIWHHGLKLKDNSRRSPNRRGWELCAEEREELTGMTNESHHQSSNNV